MQRHKKCTPSAEARNVEILRAILNELTGIERDALERFYLREQTVDVISRELQLSTVEFLKVKQAVWQKYMARADARVRIW